ncbi:flagellar hook-length control protein FliK [Veronia pacifica]
MNQPTLPLQSVLMKAAPAASERMPVVEKSDAGERFKESLEHAVHQDKSVDSAEIKDAETADAADTKEVAENAEPETAKVADENEQVSEDPVEGKSETDTAVSEGDKTNTESDAELASKQAIMDTKALLDRLAMSSAALSAKPSAADTDEVKVNNGEEESGDVLTVNAMPSGKTLPQSELLLAKHFNREHEHVKDIEQVSTDKSDHQEETLTIKDIDVLVKLVHQSPELEAALTDEQKQALSLAAESPEKLTSEQVELLTQLKETLITESNQPSTPVASGDVEKADVKATGKEVGEVRNKVAESSGQQVKVSDLQVAARAEPTKHLQDPALRQPTQIVADETAPQQATAQQAKPELSPVLAGAAGFSQNQLQKAVREGLSPESLKTDIMAATEGSKAPQVENKPEALAQQLAASFGQQGSTIAAKLDSSVAQSPLQISTNQNEAAAALAERVNIMMSKNLKQVDIRLDPPELGRVQIKLSMGSEQQASVQFTVSSQHARDALESAMPRLREMMQQQGLQLSQSSVQQQSNGNQQASTGQGQQGDGQGSSSSGRSGLSLDDDTNTLVRDVYIRPSSDGVDFYA